MTNAYGPHLQNLVDARIAQTKAEDGMRRHLGGSVLSKKCLREVWFSFRWAASEAFDGRMLRLFNRGHREEPIFAELLREIGATVWTHDKDGEQFKVSTIDGHAGGALDGVVVGLPDLPPHVKPGAPVLTEFKTHKDKLFKQLQKKGVRGAHEKHFRQAQFYMHCAGLAHCLYCAVNKDDDSLYFEFFDYDSGVGTYLINRGRTVIYGEGMPPRISENPSWHECLFCAMRGVCFGYEKARFNCRTCTHAKAQADGTWACQLGQEAIHTSPKIGCMHHQYLHGL